ncbi:helix-turn-helix domain-containing protein [Streptomyces bacillaris]
MEQSDWMTRVGTSVAGEVRRHRTAKGWSAQQLSDRCAELGLSIPRTVLSNIENGRRTNISVAELLVLAGALEVAPAALIYPVGYVEEVEVLPGVAAHPMHGVQWISGEVALPTRTAGPMGKMMRTALFYVRQLLREKARSQKSLRSGVDLQRRASEADSAALAASYTEAARHQFKAHEESERVTEEWAEALRQGMPEMGLEPIPYPDVDPYGDISIELVPDPYNMLAGLKSWGDVLSRRDE